jgi:hypothetical protein
MVKGLHFEAEQSLLEELSPAATVWKAEVASVMAVTAEKKRVKAILQGVEAPDRK